MHFEGEFRVPGTPDTVMRHFADVERMARCMPGAVIEGRGDDGSYLGAMVVAFGPKKINFRGRVMHEIDMMGHSGTLTGRGAADMRAARIGVKVTYTVQADPGASDVASVVALVSDAELTGVLADFARTGGIPVANALMAGFAERMAEEFADVVLPAEATVSPVAGTTVDPAAAATGAPITTATVVPLAAHGLVWAIIKAKILQLGRWIGLVAPPPNTEGKRG